MAKLYTTIYSKFKGVDKASDPTNIDNSRSPYAPNLISDSDGFPEKRPGWRTLHTVESPVNGMFFAMLKTQGYFIIHGGTKIYKWDGSSEPVSIKVGVKSGKSTGFVFQDKFYILTGGEYLVFDGTTITDVSAAAYIPLILIGRKPSGGGTTYESVNLLQKKRKVGFLPDGTSTVYQLPSTGIDSVDEVVIGGQATTAYTADLAKGTVTFTTAPKKPEDDGGVAGQDWVHITYSVTTAGYADRIKKCTISTTYGYGNTDRVVVSGNPDYRNTDWMSGFNDPTYFPDLGYSNVGVSSTAIMGYARVGEYLAIIKEDNDQDNTVFFRSASLSGTDVVFPMKQAIVGIGMVAKGTVATVDDEPLFLSRAGVHAITSNNLTAERTVQNRSWFVDNVLKEEPYIQNAVATSWNNQYILCVNGNAYVLDGNQDKSYKDKTNGDFIYECYTWTNIPAVCLLATGEDLYFGTADGKVCRFNTDIATVEKYNDDGAAIDAQWATKADDDGDFMRYKTMIKQGCGVQIKPYLRSSVDVIVRTESDFGNLMLSANTGIFSWEYIDFDTFTFSTVDTPCVIPFGFRVKKYITLQVIVRNNKADEGFGILGIIKRYVVMGYVK